MIELGPKIKLGEFNYYQPGVYGGFISRFLYPIDIDNDGIQEILLAGLDNGSSTTVNMQLFGVVNGHVINITDKWLPGNRNQTQGTADIVSGDFDKNGKIDIFLSGNTDSEFSANAYALMNQGDYFEKVNLGTAKWQHGASAADINKDGYTDVVVASYDSPAIYIGSPSGLIHYNLPGPHGNGSAVALADFLGNGSITAIFTDSDHKVNDTTLYQIDQRSDKFSLDWITNLPIPQLESSSLLSGMNMPDGKKSHDIRVEAFDFTNDGLSDAIIFSRGNWNGVVWPVASSVQFLKNLGNGQFVDVTDQTLFNYDSETHAPYEPIFDDFNHDGFTDIFLSEVSWGINPATSILLGQKDGTFIDTGRDVLSQAVGIGRGNVGTIVKGPDNKFFLFVESSEFVNHILVSNAYFYEIFFSDESQTIKNSFEKEIYSQAYTLYKELFPDSTPTVESISYWKSRLDNGLDLGGFASVMISSEEFSKKYGYSSNKDLLFNLCIKVLGEEPSPEINSWWENEMIFHNNIELVGSTDKIHDYIN